MVKLVVAVDKGKKVKNQKIDYVLNTSETNDVSDTEHEQLSEINDSMEACTSTTICTETKNTEIRGRYNIFVVVVAVPVAVVVVVVVVLVVVVLVEVLVVVLVVVVLVVSSISSSSTCSCQGSTNTQSISNPL